ncbi:putative protein kinase domain containing protein [Lyophyllum shimeji]|uniref:non-specific serine/threonine protein kinase n=1 Tax=Lyophyllum shimeji TaxID=47721 RepID=A0A9P3PUH8_LYOSH|nr:putative protein kinase domain containing protein [Lyophyllum shimeji]GLB43167.1 putative protein kinase domain containing protein [Lyophyllum shimeji]
MSTSTNPPAATESEEPPTFVFPEEPLGLPADTGFGYFQGKPNDVVGPDNRFHIQAKLGVGTNSSVWLAKDSQLDRYVALKILTGHASQLNAGKVLRELAVHKRLASLPADESKHCSRLITHFTLKGIEEDGEHLCLALELERATLESVWNAQNVKFYPIPIVKRILRHVLHGMAALHKCGVVHTDIKPDNIMISLAPSWSDETVSAWLRDHPPRAYGPCQSLYKVVTDAIVTEEFPTPSVEDLEMCDFKVTDLSNAQELDDQTTDNITPLTLRAPEVVLGGPWDETVDIWTFGCLVFTFLTSAPLFPDRIHPIHHCFLRSDVDPNNTDDIQVDHLLWMMMVMTDQRFPPAVLSLYPNSPEYFESNGDMKRFNTIARRPLELCIQDTGCPASQEDVAGAVSLMRRCLQFNPSARPSAKELLQDPWLIDTSL